jgi:hypothetical protein
LSDASVRVYTLVERCGREPPRRETFAAPDHETAILRAGAAVAGVAFELWCAGRLVCRRDEPSRPRERQAAEAHKIH